MGVDLKVLSLLKKYLTDESFSNIYKYSGVLPSITEEMIMTNIKILEKFGLTAKNIHHIRLFTIPADELLNILTEAKSQKKINKEVINDPTLLLNKPEKKVIDNKVFTQIDNTENHIETVLNSPQENLLSDSDYDRYEELKVKAYTILENIEEIQYNQDIESNITRLLADKSVERTDEEIIYHGIIGNKELSQEVKDSIGSMIYDSNKRVA